MPTRIAPTLFLAILNLLVHSSLYKRVLAFILGRRTKVAQSTIPAEIRGALDRIYDERGYERDPVKVTVYVGKK